MELSLRAKAAIDAACEGDVGRLQDVDPMAVRAIRGVGPTTWSELFFFLLSVGRIGLGHPWVRAAPDCIDGGWGITADVANILGYADAPRPYPNEQCFTHRDEYLSWLKTARSGDTFAPTRRHKGGFLDWAKCPCDVCVEGQEHLYSKCPLCLNNVDRKRLEARLERLEGSQ